MQNGQSSFYVHIIEQYQQSIYRYCLRLLGNEQDAEDAAQDIFIKAFESIRQYRHTASFASWLYKIAYRRCLNLLRKRNYQLRLLPRLFHPEAAAESPEQVLNSRLFSPQALFALNALSAEDRSLLILRIFEERSYEELGEITCRNPEAVKKRINRIKEKVRQKMEQWQEETIWEASHSSINLKS